MKKYIIFALMLLSTSSVMAQSGMTDDQVMSFVAKEHSAGTSNSPVSYTHLTLPTNSLV